MSDSDLAEILGRIPSGLFILTVRFRNEETGMLASWVMQAGFEPPMLTVAVQRPRNVADWLTACAPFVINVIADSDKALMKHFGRGFEPGQSAFTGLDIGRTSHDVPILPGTVGHLECTPTAHLDSGDHRVFMANIVAGRRVSDFAPYLHVRKNGLRY